MNLQEILTDGGISLLVLATLVELAPIKINPWSWIAKALGKAINADVLKEIADVKQQQQKTQTNLDKYIEENDMRNADLHRVRILRFNNELLRDLPHTQEDFIEALTDVDEYERYCEDHPRYENNRAVHAIANIKRVYDERLEKHDFLQ